MRNNAPGGGGFELAHYEPQGKYLADSKTFNKKLFSKWYGSTTSFSF